MTGTSDDTQNDSARYSALSDPDLAKVAAAWPTLPAAIRRAILALID